MNCTHKRPLPLQNGAPRNVAYTCIWGTLGLIDGDQNFGWQQTVAVSDSVSCWSNNFACSVAFSISNMTPWRHCLSFAQQYMLLSSWLAVLVTSYCFIMYVIVEQRGGAQTALTLKGSAQLNMHGFPQKCNDDCFFCTCRLFPHVHVIKENSCPNKSGLNFLFNSIFEICCTLRVRFAWGSIADLAETRRSLVLCSACSNATNQSGGRLQMYF